MIKVLFAIDSLQTGGAENSILEITSQFSAETEPLIVYFYQNDFLKAEFEKRGVRVIGLGLTGKYQFREGIRRFGEILEKEKPAMVVATLFRSEIISRIACRKHKIPNIGTFVNDTYSKFEMAGYSLSRKTMVQLFKVVNSYTARYCKAFLSNARSIKESNARALGIPVEKIKVIYRGRRIDKYSFQVEKRFNSPTIRFFSVGRLIERKGQLELIKAFSQFLSHYPDATLSIAGEGPFRPELEKEIQHLQLSSKVSLLGNVKNIPALLDSNDVFVFPSHNEGFSGALVEAMLAGIPIVASDIPMNKEAVTHQQTGYLFPVTDINRMAEGMRWVVDNKEAAISISIEGRRQAEKHFDIREVVRQHEQFYHEIAAGRSFS